MFESVIRKFSESLFKSPKPLDDLRGKNAQWFGGEKNPDLTLGTFLDLFVILDTKTKKYGRYGTKSETSLPSIVNSRLVQGWFGNSLGLCPFRSYGLLSLMPHFFSPPLSLPSRHPFQQFKDDSDDWQGNLRVSAFFLTLPAVATRPVLYPS